MCNALLTVAPAPPHSGPIVQVFNKIYFHRHLYFYHASPSLILTITPVKVPYKPLDAYTVIEIQNILSKL